MIALFQTRDGYLNVLLASSGDEKLVGLDFFKDAVGDGAFVFKVIGGSFTGNSSPKGGGIYIHTSTGSILGVTISGNTATVVGGGVCQAGVGTVTLQIAKVIANSAPLGPDVYGTFTFV